MRIVLDAMGSDTYPDPEIQAAVEAVRLFGDEIILVGNQEVLKARLPAIDNQPGIRLIHAPETLEMTDKPAENARRKVPELHGNWHGPDQIQARQMHLSLPETPAGQWRTRLFRLGRIRGVERPALTALFPVKGGHCVVLDIGANADCKPEYLLQFAVMGSVYAEKVLGKPTRGSGCSPMAKKPVKVMSWSRKPIP